MVEVHSEKKNLSTHAAPLTNIGSLGLCLHRLFFLESVSKNIENILVLVNSFTHNAQAFPTKDQKANTVARVLWDKYFVQWGLPARIQTRLLGFKLSWIQCTKHYSQGRQFVSYMVHSVQRMMLWRYSPYEIRLHVYLCFGVTLDGVSTCLKIIEGL